MYSMGAYFLEVVVDYIPGDGWTADAVFSRRADYRAHGAVHKVRYPADVVGPSRATVERATVIGHEGSSRNAAMSSSHHSQ